MKFDLVIRSFFILFIFIHEFNVQCFADNSRNLEATSDDVDIAEDTDEEEDLADDLTSISKDDRAIKRSADVELAKSELEKMKRNIQEEILNLNKLKKGEKQEYDREIMKDDNMKPLNDEKKSETTIQGQIDAVKIGVKRQMEKMQAKNITVKNNARFNEPKRINGESENSEGSSRSFARELTSINKRNGVIKSTNKYVNDHSNGKMKKPTQNPKKISTTLKNKRVSNSDLSQQLNTLKLKRERISRRLRKPPGKKFHRYSRKLKKLPEIESPSVKHHKNSKIHKRNRHAYSRRPAENPNILFHKNYENEKRNKSVEKEIRRSSQDKFNRQVMNHLTTSKHFKNRRERALNDLYEADFNAIMKPNDLTNSQNIISQLGPEHDDGANDPSDISLTRYKRMKRV